MACHQHRQRPDARGLDPRGNAGDQQSSGCDLPNVDMSEPPSPLHEALISVGTRDPAFYLHAVLKQLALPSDELVQQLPYDLSRQFTLITCALIFVGVSTSFPC